MKKITAILAGAALLLGGAPAALGQSYPPPQVQSIGPNDLVKVVPGGNPAVGDQYAVAPLLGNYSQTLAGNNYQNFLVGGDATTNLFQRATTGASETTTVAYGGPDRWAYWSGTATAMTVSRSSTAADLPAGTQYGFKMARTSGQTGVVQMCMMQEIESVNSYPLAGQTLEVDFHAATGANFSAASANMKVYLMTGTGADEGVAGSASGAFGLNAGGGGSGGWTGQVNTPVIVSLGAVSTLNRYSVAIPVPAGITEAGIALCYTPVGTAGTNDYVTFSKIQATPNSALAGVAGTAGVVLNVNDPRAKSFAHRPQAIETELQQRYFVQINEPAASKAVGTGNYQTSTICDVTIPLPVTMRAIPTLVIGGATEANTTWAVMIASTTPVVLATTYLIQDAVIGNTVSAIAVQATTAGKTAGQGCTLVGAGGGANIQASAEL